MKEHDFELNTLMGGWYISEKICDNLVLYFNENKNEHFPGMSGSKINKDIKDSVDIKISKNHNLKSRKQEGKHKYVYLFDKKLIYFIKDKILKYPA